MADFKRVLPIMAFAAKNLEQDLSLSALAEEGRTSTFHFHRLFSSAAGETPKEFVLRLRLSQAATMLLTGDDSVLNVALACGFQSHEAFSRAFQRCFGITPSAYRRRGFPCNTNDIQAKEHSLVVRRVGHCIGLFHRNQEKKSTRIDMTYSITERELAPQAALVVRRRVKQSEIASTLADLFGRIFQYAQRTGAALAGQPFMRYLEWGPGILTIAAGIPTAASEPGEGEIMADTLPGGPVATTIHHGAYDGLAQAHAAVQMWIEDSGLATAGAPWESYITDPADYPDPKDWNTEVFWPLAR